jgi:hypothetical protein
LPDVPAGIIPMIFLPGRVECETAVEKWKKPISRPFLPISPMSMEKNYIMRLFPLSGRLADFG